MSRFGRKVGKVKKLCFILALALVSLFVFVTASFADTVNLGNGRTVERTVVVSGRTVYKSLTSGSTYAVDAKRAFTTAQGSTSLTTGRGGYVASSGYRWIGTKITYKVFGDTIAYTVDRDFYRFGGGKVYGYKHVDHDVWIKNGAFYRLVRSWDVPPAVVPWNGRSLGEVRMSSRDIIRVSAVTLGDIWEMRPFHYHYGRYNGTYYWKCTY